MLERLTPRWRRALAVPALTAIYFAAGTFGLSLAFAHPSVSPVWPASGIALAAILLWGYRLWPGIFLGAFFVNITTQGTVPVASGIAIGNTLEALLGAWLIVRYASGTRAFDKAANIFKFILFGTVLNTTLAASCGAGSLTLGGFAPWSDFSTMWITWWLGDMMGALIVAPLLVIWLTQPAPSFQAARVLEAAALLVTVVSISAISFLRDIHGGLEYLAVPPLLWAAFRFGQRGAVTASFIVSAIAVLGTSQNLGPFAGTGLNEALLLLLVFMGTITATALVLAAVVAERSRAAQALHEKSAQLRLITDTASIMLAHCGLDKRFRFVNRTYAERFGLTPDDIVGQSISEIVGSAAYETIRPYVERVLRGETVEYEVEIPYERIGRRFMRAGYVPERDAQGGVTGWVAAISDITDRKKAEQALRDSEQRFQAIIDNSTAVIYVKDLEGRYILINSRYEELFGVPKPEISGKTDWDVFPEEAARRFRENDLNVIEANRSVEFEEVVPQRDGVHTYISIKFPLNDTAGKTYAVAGISTDITHRKQIEQTLRQRTRSLEIVNRVGAALAAELDLNQIVQMVTDAGREVCGAQLGAMFYNVKDERGESCKLYALSEASREAFQNFPMPRSTSVVGPTFRGERVVRIGDVLADPRYGKNPPYHGMPPGHLPVRSYLAVPVLSRSGEALGGLFFGHAEPDVFTAEAEAIITAIAAQAAIAIDNANLYKAVQQRADEFRTLIDTAPVGIAVATDPDCLKIWGNPEFSRLLGTETTENISESKPGADVRAFKILSKGREVPAEELPMQRACREAVDILGEELDIVRPDGTVTHHICSATPLRDENGRGRGAIGILLDITARKRAEAALEDVRQQLIRSNEELERTVRERDADLENAKAALLRDIEAQKKLEEQLRQAQKLESIGTLAGGVAHDFNNVLNIIKGYAGLLASKHSDDEDLAQILNIIGETIDRGALVVQQLLATARKRDAKFDRVDLNGLLERAVNLLKQTFPRTIEINSRLEPGLPLIMADRNQIDQVILNICLNARDAMPEGGRLLLKSETVPGRELRERFRDAKNDRYACVAIADTGHGMDEAVKSHIFEPFFTTKNQGEGTGLGLSVAYGIVTNHGGFIALSSQPGHGSTFSIYLPCPDTTSAAPEGARERSPARAYTILFVEDEVRQLELMRRFLEGEGHRVLVARDGVEAVEAFMRHKDEISAVVLDLGLPKLTGWEAFQKMKEVDRKLRPVFATGYLAPEVEAAMAQGELSALILKPYTLGEMLEKVTAAASARAEAVKLEAAAN